MEKQAKFTLRIDADLLAKFSHVAEKNDRSANREMERVVRAHVEAYEKEHGPISLEG